jgi:hypothetical protein
LGPVDAGFGDLFGSLKGASAPAWASLIAAAAVLFLATVGLSFRGLAVLSPIRWATIEEILPLEARSAWVEFLDPESLALARRVPLSRLEDEASGAVLWAWQGYLRQRGPAQFRVLYSDLVGHTVTAEAAPVEATVEVGGVSSELSAPTLEPIEVLTV